MAADPTSSEFTPPELPERGRVILVLVLAAGAGLVVLAVLVLLVFLGWRYSGGTSGAGVGPPSPTASAVQQAAYQRGLELREAGERELAFDVAYRHALAGRWEAAVAAFDAVIDAEPDRAQAYLMRGRARQELGEVSGALDDYSRAIELVERSAGSCRGPSKTSLC